MYHIICRYVYSCISFACDYYSKSFGGYIFVYNTYVYVHMYYVVSIYCKHVVYSITIINILLITYFCNKCTTTNHEVK